MDLLFTSESDPLYYYLNEGTKEEFAFKNKTAVTVNGNTIKYQRPQVQVADLNNDGLFDLLVGNGLTASSRIYYYENKGSLGSPDFKEREELCLKTGNPIDPDYDVHFCIADWNCDGGLDILYSGYSSSLKLLTGDPTNTDLVSSIIKNQVKTHVQCYKNKLTIQCGNSKVKSIMLLSTSGKLICTKKYSQYELKEGIDFSIPAIGEGVYLLLVRTGGGDIIHRIRI